MKSLRHLLLLSLFISLSCTTPPETPPLAVSSDGINIEYDSYGEKGPAVVLVHGWSNNRSFWDPHVPTLSETHRVVTLDLAGFGDSGDSRSAWTMEAFGQDVAAVVNALGLEDVVLVGFSMGGAAVLEAAVSIPESIAGVVLVDVFQDVNAQYDTEFIEGWVDQVGSAWHQPEAFGSFIAPDAPELLVERLIAKTPAVPPDHWWAAVREFWKWSDSELTGTIEAVTAPIAAINAEEPPTDVEAFRSFAPEFDVVTVSEVGHIGVIWMKTDEFDRILANLVSGMVGAG
jgi:pimeloyl-ACP methyl ester carboxylesterase